MTSTSPGLNNSSAWWMARLSPAAVRIVKAGPDWQKYRLRRLRYALQDAWAEAKRAAKAAAKG